VILLALCAAVELSTTVEMSGPDVGAAVELFATVELTAPVVGVVELSTTVGVGVAVTVGVAVGVGEVAAAVDVVFVPIAEVVVASAHFAAVEFVGFLSEISVDVVVVVGAIDSSEFSKGEKGIRLKNDS
jgi:putative effector of murein hydrolase LrgA (UPF0299 family)